MKHRLTLLVCCCYMHSFSQCFRQFIPLHNDFYPFQWQLFANSAEQRQCPIEKKVHSKFSAK